MNQVTTHSVRLRRGNYIEADGLQSFEFQCDLQDKLLDDVTRLIFLSAETGGGKTRGFTLPALKTGRNLIIVAPTNALIYDIRRNVEVLIERMQRGGATVNHEVQVVTRYALYTLNKREAPSSYRPRQGEALLEILRGADPGSPRPPEQPLILITNPDSLAVAMQMLYFEAERILGEILHAFPWIVFDEFHAYTPKQIPAIFYLHALIKTFADSPGRKTVFSSATPAGQFEAALRKLLDLGDEQVHVETVDPVHLHDQDAFQILQTTDFTLVKREAEWDISALRRYVADHLSDIRKHLKTPNHRVCIIANSVFEASEIADMFRAESFKVEEIRGFMNLRDRGEGIAPAVIGTSAIEMGINFPISMLFTEGLEGPALIQRIGRLGRTQSGEHAIAHVLVPSGVYEKLQVLNGKTVLRTEFRDSVLASYPIFEDFWSYVRQFGLYENRYYIHRLAEYNAERRAPKARSEGPRQAAYFEAELLPRLARAYGLRDWQAHLKWLDEKIIVIPGAKEAVEAALCSTRGETIPMTCAIYDRADINRGYFPCKTYDTRLILARGDIVGPIDPWEDEEKKRLPSWYLKAAKRWRDTVEWDEHWQEVMTGHVDLFVELNGLREVYSPVEYEAATRRLCWLQPGQLYAFPLRYRAESLDLMTYAGMSNVLEEKSVLTFVIKASKFRGTLRQEKNLPPVFEITTLYLQGRGFQVAFGVNALYMWSKLLEAQHLATNV
jgi:CRISPR-associated helicase Cas3